MIKNPLEPEENRPDKIKTEPEDKAADDSTVDETFESYFAEIESPQFDAEEQEHLSEISEPGDDELILLEKPKETIPTGATGKSFDLPEQHFNQPANSFSETINHDSVDEMADEQTNNRPLTGFPVGEINFDLPSETATEKRDFESASEIWNEKANHKQNAEIVNETTTFDSPVELRTKKTKFENSDMLFQSPAEPESFAETARKSGLAYAAAITLFGSIVFMLLIGWFADLLLGSSPWGIVIGIILGAAIGFFQFFRLTSQILKDKD